MQIQVNTDHNIAGHEALTAHVNSVVAHILDHLSEHITRVEVHLSDENSHKGGQNDKRCMMEARLGHFPPIAVTHYTDNVAQAIKGAAEKLTRSIESHLGRLRDHHLRNTVQDSLEPEALEDDAEKS